MSIGTNLSQYIAQVSRICSFYTVGNGILVSATTSSSAVQFPIVPDGMSANDVLLVNTSTDPVFVTFGNASPIAVIPGSGTPNNGICILGGSSVVINKGPSKFIAAITASNPVTLYAYQGYGVV